MNQRQAFYDERADRRPEEASRHYHTLLKNHYSFLVPGEAKVLEVGCGIGDLLESVQPARGVGIDFSRQSITFAKRRHKDCKNLEFKTADACEFEAGEKFDYILASDLVNDLPDVQAFLEKLHEMSHKRTRLVINFFNTLWRPVLNIAVKCGFKSPTPMQNWLSLNDMENLLKLAGWEVVKNDTRILWPAKFPVVGDFLNRWIAPLLKPLNLTIFIVARPRPKVSPQKQYSCTVVIPSRNESGNIEAAVQRTPEMGKGTEIIFIEGGSSDDTWEEIQRVQKKYKKRDIKCMQQTGKGKGNAVREAYEKASGDILFILDADLTVPPEQLPKFYEAVRSGKAEFVNGVRLVYPMEDEAMRFFNMIGNKFFSMAFTWLLGQSIKDTLCGTKVMFRKEYEELARNRNYFGEFDPFGDFDLIFGASKLNLQIVDLPIRYQARTYGDTNISRWSHGWLLLKMVAFAARRLKFIK